MNYLDSIRVIFTILSGLFGIGCGTAARHGEWIAAAIMAVGCVLLFVGRAIFDAILYVAQKGEVRV